MKILYISLDPRQPFNAHTGGATHIREMIQALRDEGQDVEVIAPGANESPDLRAQRAAPLRGMAKSIVPDALWLLACDLNDIRLDRKKEPEIEQAVQNFKPDIIYERNSYLFASAARVAERTGLPYFLEINAPTAEERKANYGAPLVGWHRRIESFQHRVSRGIVVVSEPLKQYLVNSGVERKKIRIAPNGVRPERFDCAEKGLDIREKLGLRGPVIGFVGSLASYHGFDRLFDAMPPVREAFPDATALVVGGGPLLGDVRKHAAKAGIADAVHFVGEVGPEDVPGYVAAFDAAVLLQTAEYCSPIKLFEYGAAGVPVIAPRTAPVSAILGPKGNGILLNASDSLADAIIVLLKDRNRARKMGESFRKRVLEQYTWRHTALRVIRFIEERLK